MKKYLELIRIKHGVKNLLVFLPVICGRVFNFNSLFDVLISFFAFSFMTSFIYIVNDIRDIDKDKKHPRKKKRPLPSGRIRVGTAIFVAFLMLIFSVLLNMFLTSSIYNLSLVFLLIYMVSNILYSFGLKDVVIIDVFILSLGFLLRVYYGASIVDIEVSNWLFLTILTASLFLGVGKRKKEYFNNKDSRKVLSDYDGNFLDKFQYIFLSLTFVFYSLWAMEQSIKYMFLTIPILMIIFMKYCLIIEKSDDGDPITILYQDKILFLLCGLYGLVMLVLMVI